MKHIFDEPDADEDKVQETLGYQIVHPPNRLILNDNVSSMALHLSELEANLIHVTGTGLVARLKIEDVPWFPVQQTRVEE